MASELRRLASPLRPAGCLDATHTIMIGDTMETDILGGVQMGCPTVLVLSGGAKMADLAKYAYRPDMIVKSLGHVHPKKIIRMCKSLPRVATPPSRLSAMAGCGS